MKKSILWMKKLVLLALLASALSIVIVPVEMASPTFTVTQSDPETTVYFDPPTINGTVIGQEFTVNITIRDADEIHNWQAGLIFDPTVLECTGFFKGEFLWPLVSTTWDEGTIDNTEGVITPYGSGFYGFLNSSGDGRLAYVNFTVIAPGVSDLHLLDVKVRKLNPAHMPIKVPINIIDVYTVVEVTPPQTVVIVSNSTGRTGDYHSGFYDHAFNASAEEISFKVTGPSAGFSNVTIPKELLELDPQHVWVVIIDGKRHTTADIIVTENITHTFLYFTYGLGIHEVQITTRFIPSTISIDLSSNSIVLESNVTVSGGIDPVRANVTVAVLYRLSGETEWAALANVTTNESGNYSYSWTPEKVRTYEVKASWEGDETTLGDESSMQTLVVQPIPPSTEVEEVDGIYVFIESNSTVFDFAFNETLNEISFNVTRPYGDMYFSNVTIPKTLVWAENLDEWAVIIDSRRLGTEERTITTNTTHTSIYFNYTSGIHKIQINARLVLSTISIAISSNSVILGSNVTVSGGIDPVRANVTVAVLYRLSGETEWAALANVTTNESGNYSYSWTPETIETFEFKVYWEGDEDTFGDESDPPYPNLAVQSIPSSVEVEQIVWETQVLYVVIDGNSTISDFHFSQPDKRISFNVTSPYGGIYFSNVTIPKELLGGPYQVYIDGEFTISTKTENETHAFLYFTYGLTTHKVEIKGFSVIQESSIISITLSPPSVTVGSNVTVSGGIDPVRANVTVAVLYRLSGETEWAALANVTTNESGNYSYSWTPTETGTYEVKASWEGDETTLSAESDVETLTVKGAAGIDLYVVAAAVAAIVIIAAIAIYFIKFRKPR